MSHASSLNSRQLEAVQAGDGAWLVIAGAGTGKTRTLTYRVAHLIDQGVSPDAILLCTFTNKAANEMLTRVEDLVAGEVSRIEGGEVPNNPRVIGGEVPNSPRVIGGTFHHVANRFLRQHAEVLGLAASYTILDSEDASDLLSSCIASEMSGREAVRAPVLSRLIGMAVNTMTPMDETIRQYAPELNPRRETLLEVAQAYQERKREMNLMDFDDLLWLFWRLLEEQPELGIGQGFQHVLVDEYQDTSRLQARIVDHLAAVHGNLTVVGDDAQSIYRFRGAEADNLLGFLERWPEAGTIKLEENYRSSEPILNLANASIAHNPKQMTKRLYCRIEDGPKPCRIPVQDVEMQAAFVAQRVAELHDVDGLSLSEMAVLYRAHHHSMELQVELTRRGIPFLVRSGLRFFEQAHIKDVLAHLRVLDNPADELSWARCLRLQAGIGRAGADRIIKALRGQDDFWRVVQSDAFAAGLPARSRKGFAVLIKILSRIQTEKVGETITLLLKEGYGEKLIGLYTHPESRREDIEQFAAYAGRFSDLRTFLSELNLSSGIVGEEVLDAGAAEDALVLSSIHQAKGLEWTAVFLLWLNEGQVPHARALGEEGGLAEERRLFYVALTRAKRWLHLISCQVDDRPGRNRILLRPSRFLAELEPDLMDLWRIEMGA